MIINSREVTTPEEGVPTAMEGKCVVSGSRRAGEVSRAYCSAHLTGLQLMSPNKTADKTQEHNTNNDIKDNNSMQDNDTAEFEDLTMIISSTSGHQETITQHDSAQHDSAKQRPWSNMLTGNVNNSFQCGSHICT